MFSVLKTLTSNGAVHGCLRRMAIVFTYLMRPRWPAGIDYCHEVSVAADLREQVG
jgi:hypothetical protein